MFINTTTGKTFEIHPEKWHETREIYYLNKEFWDLKDFYLDNKENFSPDDKTKAEDLLYTMKTYLSSRGISINEPWIDEFSGHENIITQSDIDHYQKTLAGYVGAICGKLEDKNKEYMWRGKEEISPDFFATIDGAKHIEKMINERYRIKLDVDENDKISFDIDYFNQCGPALAKEVFTSKHFVQNPYDPLMDYEVYSPDLDLLKTFSNKVYSEDAVVQWAKENNGTLVLLKDNGNVVDKIDVSVNNTQHMQ